MKKPKAALATRMLPSTERWEIYAIVLLDKPDKGRTARNIDKRTLQGYGVGLPRGAPQRLPAWRQWG